MVRRSEESRKSEELKDNAQPRGSLRGSSILSRVFGRQSSNTLPTSPTTAATGELAQISPTSPPLAQVPRPLGRSSGFRFTRKSTVDLRNRTAGVFDMSVPDVPPVPALPARRPEDGFAPFNPPLEPGLRVSNNNAGHESVPRIPKNLTATYAEVSFGIGQQKYDMDGNMETWFEASIKGAVTNVEEALTVKEHLETALDVMILVDNSKAATPDFVQASCKNAYYIASALDPLTDRLAIACLSSDSYRDYEIVLPMGPCSYEMVENAFKALNAQRLPDREPEAGRISGALRDSSGWLLRQSSRGAFRQLFLLTPQRKLILSAACRSDLLRIHTVTPAPSVDITSPRGVSGWHLSTAFGLEVEPEVVNAFKAKLNQVVTFVRLGVDPGVLQNLNLELTTRMGTVIKTSLAAANKLRLRPGETWNCVFQAVTPGHALPRRYEHGEPSQDDLYQDIEDILEGPNYVTAIVKYEQSAYPRDVTMETKAVFDLGTSPRDGSFNDPHPVIRGVEQVELIRDDISDTLPGGLGEPYEGTYLPANNNAQRGHESQEQSEGQFDNMAEADGQPHRAAQFGRGQYGRGLNQERGRGDYVDEKNIHPLFRTGASDLSEGANAHGSEPGLKPEHGRGGYSNEKDIHPLFRTGASDVSEGSTARGPQPGLKPDYGRGGYSNEKDIHPLFRAGASDISEPMGALGIGQQRGSKPEHNRGNSNDKNIRPVFRGRPSDRSEGTELGLQQEYGRDRSNDKNIHPLFRGRAGEPSDGSGAPAQQGRRGASLQREHGRGFMNQDTIHPLLRGRPTDLPEGNDDLGQEGRAPLRSMNAYPGRGLFPKPSENNLRRGDPSFH